MFEFIMMLGFLLAATSQLLPPKPSARKPGTLGKTVPGRIDSRYRPGQRETAKLSFKRPPARQSDRSDGRRQAA